MPLALIGWALPVSMMCCACAVTLGFLGFAAKTSWNSSSNAIIRLDSWGVISGLIFHLVPGLASLLCESQTVVATNSARDNAWPPVMVASEFTQKFLSLTLWLSQLNSVEGYLIRKSLPSIMVGSMLFNTVKLCLTISPFPTSTRSCTLPTVSTGVAQRCVPGCVRVCTLPQSP